MEQKQKFATYRKSQNGTSANSPAFSNKSKNQQQQQSSQQSQFGNPNNTYQQQQGNNIQQASEILKNLNFSLNPHLHKRKKRESLQDTLQLNKKPKPSAVTRNILELRDRSNKKNISLMDKPRLKQTKSFKQGSLSILKNNAEARNYITNKYQGFVNTGHQTLGEKGKDKLRLQVVRWFVEHKNEIVQLINDKKNQIIEWIEYVKQVNKSEFELIMDNIGLKKDRNLLNRLFWLFDLNGDDQIDCHEIVYAINLFKEENLEKKVQTFFELADENQDGYVSADELKRFLVKNLHSESDIKQAKFLCQDFVDELNPQNPQLGFTEEELLFAAEIEQSTRIVVEKNTRILKTSKADDYVIPLSSLIPVQETDTKPGSFFPYIDTVMKMVTEKEQTYEKYHNIKFDNQKKNNQNNQDQNDSESEDH